MVSLKAMVDNAKPEDLTNGNESTTFLRTALSWKGSVTPRIVPRVLWSGVYSVFVFGLIQIFPDFYLSITPFEYSGAVLGLLLVARVNSGMDRWWEARKLWGSIVNQSRNLATIGYQYSSEDSPWLKVFLRHVALFPYVVKERLRDESELSEAISLVGELDQRKLKKAPHGPVYMGNKLAQILKQMRSYGLDDFSFQRAERERALLIDAVGACERIKSTPMPLVLAIKTRRFILLFLILLPFALVNRVGGLTPFIMMLTSYPLFCLDEIGVQLQNPFAKSNLSHLPLNTICENIKNNVLSVDEMASDELSVDLLEKLPTSQASFYSSKNPDA